MRQTGQLVRRAAVVLALTVVGVACGDGDDQARTVEVTTTSATEAAESDQPAAETVESRTTTTAEAPPSAMDSVVVTLQDLPSGWTVSAPEEDDEEDDEICNDQDPFNAVEPVEEAESNFEQGSFGPFLSSIAGRYDGSDAAQGVLDALADAVNECQTFTETEDGIETTYTFTALSFPKLGDDTYAARLSADSPFGPLALDFAFARVDDAVVGVINGGLGAADTALTESMLRLMVNRL